MAGTLGVRWAQYIGFVPLLWLTPLFSILYGFTGISIKHVNDEKNRTQAEMTVNS